MQHARSDMYFQSFHCAREGREGPLQLLFSEARVFCMHAPCTRRILQPHGVVYHRVRVRREYGQISFPCFPKLSHPVTSYFGCKNINVHFWRERTPQITRQNRRSIHERRDKTMTGKTRHCANVVQGQIVRNVCDHSDF